QSRRRLHFGQPRPGAQLMRRSLLAAAAIAALFLAAAAGSCRYDPVPQGIIDDLGPEQGAPSEMHRPGQPCLGCHSAYVGAQPQMAFGGTIYTLDDKGAIVPASGVTVNV